MATDTVLNKGITGVLNVIQKKVNLQRVKQLEASCPVPL
jgi:hypothetical protein